MTTNEGAELRAPAMTTDDDPASGRPASSWWHRGHPVFTPLSGFFTGLVVVIAVPGVFGALLTTFLGSDTAERVFPFVLVILGIPLVLLAVPRTRTFGRYMLIGMVTTAIVVIGVGALTLWLLIANDA